MCGRLDFLEIDSHLLKRTLEGEINQDTSVDKDSGDLTVPDTKLDQKGIVLQRVDSNGIIGREIDLRIIFGLVVIALQ